MAAGRPVVIAGCGVVAVASNVAMARCAKVMRETGGVGIVPFELLGSWEKAGPVVAAWTASGRGLVAARRAILVDFPFLVAYGLGLFKLARPASALAARGFVVAAALDAVENVALLNVLQGPAGTDYPRIAALAARAKFGLVIAGAVVTAAACLGRSSTSARPTPR